MPYQFILILMLITVFSNRLGASESNTDPEFESLLEMPIEELMNVVVSVASLKEEKLTSSPAIVSTFTRADMQAIGLHSLKDILSFFPGFIINEPLLGPPVVQVRGLADINNQKILFLLDDTPIWNSANGNIPLLGIPFELIHKVEVIRGPGSVIYGTNATAGVVKIVTRRTKTSSISATLGENEYARGSGYHQFSRQHGTDKQDRVTRLAYEGQHDSGYTGAIENTLTGPPDISPTEDGSIPRSEESKSLYVSQQYESWNGFVHVAQTKKSGSSFGTIREQSIYKEDVLLLHTDYTVNAGNTKTNLFIDYNNYYSTIEIRDLLTLWNIPGNGQFAYNDSGKDNFRVRGGVQSTITVSPQHTLLVGVEQEKRSSGDYLLFDDNNGNNLNSVPVPGFSTTPGYNGVLIHGASDSTENTFYLQSDSAMNHFRFLVGIRYVDNNRSGYKTIPRIASVYHFDDVHSIKMLYSVGFNSPTFRQNAAVGAFGVSTSADLEAETVRSLDLAYHFSKDNQLFVTNLFYIQARDIIGSENGFFVNSEEFERAGIEVDHQYRNDAWMLYSNLSYLVQGDTVDEDDPSATYSPKWNASMGLRYSITHKHQIGGSLRAVSKRNGADGSSIVNLQYQHKRKNYSTFISVINVLDEETFHPDVRSIGTTDIQVQAYPQRNVTIGLEYRY